MGPSLDLSLRRQQPAGQDLHREALKQPKTAKKKVGGSVCSCRKSPALGPVMVYHLGDQQSLPAMGWGGDISPPRLWLRASCMLLAPSRTRCWDRAKQGSDDDMSIS